MPNTHNGHSDFPTLKPVQIFPHKMPTENLNCLQETVAFTEMEQNDTDPDPQNPPSNLGNTNRPAPAPRMQSNYHGIRSRSGKWVSEIREPRKTTRIWLGTFPTQQMAAVAYDVAALALKGPDATLNFPHLAYLYPIPASLNAADIRVAATAAANARSPQPQIGSSSHQHGRGQESAGQVENAAGREFVDEEELFDMPNLMVDMAEGMLVSPPRMKSPEGGKSPDNADSDNLWNYP